MSPAPETPGRARIGVLIAEDEPLARQALRDLIGDQPDLQIVGEATDGLAAVRLIDSLEPEVVFLDVQMPELSGLGVLERVKHRPAVIFTTAYDTYAVSAFELEAVDYLRKPFGARRFGEALRRARKTLADGGADDALGRAREALDRGQHLRRLFVPDGARIVAVRIDEVTRFEASGDYVRIHFGAGSHLVRGTLAALVERLDPQLFVRIHRSHVVNVDHIEEIVRDDDRRFRVQLRDGVRLLASRAGSARLRALM